MPCMCNRSFSEQNNPGYKKALPLIMWCLQGQGANAMERVADPRERRTHPRPWTSLSLQMNVSFYMWAKVQPCKHLESRREKLMFLLLSALGISGKIMGFGVSATYFVTLAKFHRLSMPPLPSRDEDVISSSHGSAKGCGNEYRHDASHIEGTQLREIVFISLAWSWELNP